MNAKENETAPQTSPYRTVLRLCVGGEETIEMEELRKGDRFRLVTDDPEDHLFEQGHVVYVAASDSVCNATGVWGVQVEFTEGVPGVARYERDADVPRTGV